MAGFNNLSNNVMTHDRLLVMKIAVDVEVSDKWCENVTPILKQQIRRDIFDMDKTAMFYNMQPNGTLALKGERCQRGKRCKDKMTVTVLQYKQK
jgi:hypothetical protein